MADKISKLDQLKLLGANRLAKSSDGGRESRPAPASGGGPLPTAHKIGDACSALEPPNRVTNIVGRQQESKRAAGVAPSPSEAKPKRAPRGTFDRKAYQRELMRKRRSSERSDG